MVSQEVASSSNKIIVAEWMKTSREAVSKHWVFFFHYMPPIG
jgi:hypothetical protein